MLVRSASRQYPSVRIACLLKNKMATSLPKKGALGTLDFDLAMLKSEFKLKIPQAYLFFH